MDEPLRVEEPRISKTSLFWLVFLVLANLSAIYAFWLSTSAEPAAVVSENAFDASLVLVDELDEDDRRRISRDTQPEQPTPAITEFSALVCRAWGPFTDLADVESRQARIADIGSAIEVRTSEIAGDPDFLVYIDTGNNSDTARRTLLELQYQSVDAYIIAGGPFVSSVSVGVFSRPERAQNQRERVSALGYDARLQELSRSQTVYHLIARVPNGFGQDQPEALDPGVDCSAIASVQ